MKEKSEGPSKRERRDLYSGDLKTAMRVASSSFRIPEEAIGQPDSSLLQSSLILFSKNIPVLETSKITIQETIEHLSIHLPSRPSLEVEDSNDGTNGKYWKFSSFVP